ncbi:hypothetical protein PABG_04308 [Paracoccidioides brasiliensis Pb03]|uniref:S-adenosyl-L-methionine-dependent methyltransferase n=2 Tax=Paracoccidioides brasiliensis TaxID=121759 RepID=C1GCG9_PARBD|nr:uncharacterized protein PADG_04691 [Paracoccidioides brasiliensis Pb18]EEH22097.2 hypothetical protein PABG_04308 [Paracoccidioides brasiliensis Pb03]EEH48612.1 hypothetical protein PADG_04691 [Paracoccidioides brasiliensis Pb18]ODH44921.1 hypothetical protein ACO22_00544 [Paracoccidioides brasiliensis]
MATNSDQGEALDIDQEDIDSTFGDDVESDTKSLTSSIQRYRIENGRRYQSYREGAYYAPNDEKANETLDIAHHSYLLLLDQKLYLAPLEKPQKVLDIGTGTGIWAIDFGEEQPQANVIGTDLSPIQPSWVPPNVCFLIEDCTEYPWAYADNSMDFIHIRDLFGCIPDWSEFLDQCYKTTKPGGYVEILNRAVWLEDDDGSIPKDENHVLNIWKREFREVGDRMGKTTTIIERQREEMEKAGFLDVTERIFKMPLGSWPKDKGLKEVGRFYFLECTQGLEGWSMALLTRVMGWGLAEVHVLLARFRQAMNDRSIHSYVPISVVYGRKPLS